MIASLNGRVSEVFDDSIVIEVSGVGLLVYVPAHVISQVRQGENAKFYTQLNDKLTDFIVRQKLFFVATADHDGRINVSPKGADSLRVLGVNRVAWLNLTGSGNETAAHVLETQRMTLMFCAFEGRSKILRLYGQAGICYPGDECWDELAARFPEYLGARQIFDLQIESMQTSCGFGVPLFAYQGDRPELAEWAERKGQAGIREYWETRNAESIDGKPTRPER